MIAMGTMLCACGTKKAVQKNILTPKEDATAKLIKRDSSTIDTAFKTRFALTRPDEEGFYDYVDAYYQDMKKIFSQYMTRVIKYFSLIKILYMNQV